MSVQTTKQEKMLQQSFYLAMSNYFYMDIDKNELQDLISFMTSVNHLCNKKEIYELVNLFMQCRISNSYENNNDKHNLCSDEQFKICIKNVLNLNDADFMNKVLKFISKKYS